MAKAIYGHTGADARLAVEVARLRVRVRDLEAEVARLAAAAELAQDWVVPEDLLVPDPR
ncbi:MAG: hypothetical protein RL134_1539 [Actinomycetota bacterium]|jgi:hypothetical protein